MKFVEEIREELRKMEKGEVFLFIISLLSRQKTFFDKIASINNWCENEIISSVYNEVKKNVLVPENFMYEREKRDLDKIKKGEFEIDEMQEMIIPIDGLF